uniref:PPM-type phosphatase domain-containing protein n=1 Tax=viral metagenome TaxID=1070528 RepID=A0A6C0B9Y4_9ZZZZ
MSHAITINESIRQMDKGQDQTFSGTFVCAETGKHGSYGLVTDGHGTHACIQCLRAIPRETLDAIVGSTTPVQNLAQYINENSYIPIEPSSGATMCLAKVYPDRVIIFNSGDSQAAVYVNDQLAFLSEEHNCENQSEIERIKQMGVTRFEDSHNIEVVSETKMVGITSKYAIFPPYLRLASTQALGHNGRTGIAPDVAVVPFKQDDAVRVVIGSDGLWDMVLKQNIEEMNSFASKTSAELVEFAVTRWLQPWNMYNDKKTEAHVLARYQPNQCDDICVVKIDVLPVEVQMEVAIAVAEKQAVEEQAVEEQAAEEQAVEEQAEVQGERSQSLNNNNIFEPFPIIYNNIQNILHNPE